MNLVNKFKRFYETEKLYSYKLQNNKHDADWFFMTTVKMSTSNAY